MPRAVFDCVVLLQAAARASGPAAACLDAVRQGRLELYVSSDILAEVRDVLDRPKTRAKFPALTDEAVDLFLLDVINLSVRIDLVPRAWILSRDPKDEPYLNLALATGAEYLITRDKDLLDLMKEEEFRKQYPSLQIIDPPALLRDLEQGSSILRPIQ